MVTPRNGRPRLGRRRQAASYVINLAKLFPGVKVGRTVGAFPFITFSFPLPKIFQAVALRSQFMRYFASQLALWLPDCPSSINPALEPSTTKWVSQ